MNALLALLFLAGPLNAGAVRAIEPVTLGVAPAVAGATALEPSALALPALPAVPGLPALPAPTIQLALPPKVQPVGSAPAAPKLALAAVVPQAPGASGGSGGGKAGPAAAESADGAGEAASLARRFDGAALYSATQRVAGGKVEHSAYRADDGATVWVSRSLAAGRYEARGTRLSPAARPGASARASRAEVTARLKAGVLEVRLGGDAAALDEGGELDRALAAFGPGVRAVQGGWSKRDLAAFNAALRAGASPEQAALEATAVGRWASSAGFSRVILPPAARVPMPLFVRPEDAVTGRDGAVWRRAHGRTKRGITLDRFESGARTVWLERRDENGERLVFEFHGEHLPPPGTPADAMALFSRGKDGAIKPYVRAEAALVLDADAEQRAFEGR